MDMQPFIESTTDKLNLILEKISSLEERVNKTSNLENFPKENKLTSKENNSLNLKFFKDGTLNIETIDLIDLYYQKTYISLYSSRFLDKLIFNDKDNFLLFLSEVNSDFINNPRKQEKLIKLGYNNITSVPIIFYHKYLGNEKLNIYLKQYSDISLISEEIKNKDINGIFLY